jgi:hypothetical protein
MQQVGILTYSLVLQSCRVLASHVIFAQTSLSVVLFLH